ncbi:hypothetical protein A4D02_11830 [Niastella koreensis]|uniref:Uncharacterized protein n=1 Tax=Niastella koreensis TaxID=354356 RepID=A0ABX3NP82_9BACT|nr:hypothetical protein A4D02_11830 [Niastella koreensis]
MEIVKRYLRQWLTQFIPLQINILRHGFTQSAVQKPVQGFIGWELPIIWLKSYKGLKFTGIRIIRGMNLRKMWIMMHFLLEEKISKFVL